MDDYSRPENLHAKLDEIREKGGIEITGGCQCLYAYPVKFRQEGDTAIGMSILQSQYTPELHKKIQKTLRSAAAELSCSTDNELIIS